MSRACMIQALRSTASDEELSYASPSILRADVGVPRVAGRDLGSLRTLAGREVHVQVGCARGSQCSIIVLCMCATLAGMLHDRLK